MSTNSTSYTTNSGNNYTLNTAFFTNNNNQNFKKFDLDGDNKLTRQEIAKAAVYYMDQEPNDGMVSILSTFLVGGINKNGLFFDTNRDGGMSISEFQALAAKSGGANIISKEDFAAAFPTLASNGNTIDEQKIRNIANNTTTDPGTGGTGNNKDFLELFLSFFRLIFESFGRRNNV